MKNVNYLFAILAICFPLIGIFISRAIKATDGENFSIGIFVFAGMLILAVKIGTEASKDNN